MARLEGHYSLGTLVRVVGAAMRKLAAAIGLAVVAAHAGATPITITQTFSDVVYNDYDVATGLAYGKQPTGDWIFRGTVDSNAVNISPWPGIGAYQLTSLTLTQASLGLFDVRILNASVLFFYPDRFGFAFDVHTAPPWTVIVYGTDHFSSAQTLEQYLALATPPAVQDPFTSFGPQWEGFQLTGERYLYGVGNGLGIPTVSVAAITEPGTLAMLLLGYGLLVYGRRSLALESSADAVARA